MLKLQLSNDKRYIKTEDNKPFFWLGDTAWELIHRLNKEEIKLYFRDRSQKGFTIIQTVILAELDGLNMPNAYGDLPLIDNNPTKINEKYFKYVDFVLKEAEKFGLYVALLPTWGDKFNIMWGKGPEIFTPENAKIYGEILAKRYKNQNNIVWVLGGDRIPEKKIHFNIIRAMVDGIRTVDKIHLISYHPTGEELAADYFNDEWLDIDMFQSGHSRIAKEYYYVRKSYKLNPLRPVISGESRYENIPDRFWEKEDFDWLDEADVRVSAYWSMFAGAAGYTYGCNDVWQMYTIEKEPVIYARTDWKTALNLPGSYQMKYLKKLFSVFEWQNMKNNQSLVLNENIEDNSYIMCLIGDKKDVLIAYTPIGKPIKLDLSIMNTEKVTAFWYNPRNGNYLKVGTYLTSENPEFTPWAKGKGSDFVLVLVGEKSNFL